MGDTKMQTLAINVDVAQLEVTALRHVRCRTVRLGAYFEHIHSHAHDRSPPGVGLRPYNGRTHCNVAII